VPCFTLESNFSFNVFKLDRAAVISGFMKVVELIALSLARLKPNLNKRHSVGRVKDAAAHLKS
jgi:hypothetical protein